MNEFNLPASNTCFEKRRKTVYEPCDLLRINFPRLTTFSVVNVGETVYMTAKAHSSSNPVGSDHRIVVGKCKLSLRSTKKNFVKKLKWATLKDQVTSATISNEIRTKWNECLTKDYSNFVDISMSSCRKHIPVKKSYKEIEPLTISQARNEVLQSLTGTISNEIN